MDGDLAAELLARCRAAGGSARVPSLKEPLVYDALEMWDRRAEFARFGLEFSGSPGPNNKIILDADGPPSTTKMTVHFYGGGDHLIMLASSHKLHSGVVRLEGFRQTLIVDRRKDRPFHAQIIQRGPHTGVYIGENASSNGAALLVDGDETWITVGEDCMLSHGIEISTSDSHGVFDLDTLTQLNQPASVHLGRHVWLGSQVSIAKGVEVGDGSIIGTKSLVTKRVHPHTMVAGIPATEIRQNVSWTRSRNPRNEQKTAVRRFLNGPEV